MNQWNSKLEIDLGIILITSARAVKKDNGRPEHPGCVFDVLSSFCLQIVRRAVASIRSGNRFFKAPTSLCADEAWLVSIATGRNWKRDTSSSSQRAARAAPLVLRRCRRRDDESTMNFSKIDPERSSTPRR